MLALALAACAPGAVEPAAGPAAGRGVVVRRAEPPSAVERYCAWFGDRAGPVFYFGQAAFWSAYRAGGGDPRGDLAAEGPQLIGRLDLARERLLPPLDVTRAGARSGVWDVLAHPNGRVYFTTFFEAASAGWVDPRTGASALLPAVGPGLAELALASGGQLVAARYAHPDRRDGSVVRFSADGFVVAEHVLAAPEGRRVAPKSVAYDRVREETWVLTDLLPDGGDGPVGHDARVLDRRGHERLRIGAPEIQFVHFDRAGTGYLAEVAGASLALRILGPGDAEAPLERGRVVPLDADFPAQLDFVQDLQPADDGRVVVTRWSGRIHVVDPAAPDGAPRTLTLPRPDDGLYYTGVIHGDRLCATRCADVAVVCRDAPPGR